jgi:hypothetical protein
MCFSKEVSLFTFIFGVFSGLLCYSTNLPDYKIIGIFFAFISLMQGIEYLLWSHQLCDNYNKFLSYMGMLLNHLQPLVLLLLIYFYSRDNFNKYKSILLLLISIYLILIIIYSYKFKNECTIKNQNNNLYWKWNDMDNKFIVYLVFLICLISFGFVFPNKNIGIAFSVYTLLTYLVSFFIYYNTKVIGSMWCFFAVFAPMLFYIFKNVN